MKYDLWASQREKAEVDSETGLKVLREGPSQTGKVYAMIWNPKATKPFANYSFRSVESREKYIAEAIAGHKAHNAMKAKWKAERNGTPEDMAKVQVGDIFCNSWGYDQTNVDYYQVVSKSGRSVNVREIACESVPGSEGFMSDRVKPVKDAFLDNAPVIKKQVYFSSGVPHLNMKHGSCGKVDANSEHYRSWYA